MNKKRIVLIITVLAEFLIGSLFLYNYYSKKTSEKVLGVETATKIDKSKTVFKNLDNLKYYWEFIPDQKHVSHQDWMEEEVVYNINKDGLNDLYDYEVEKDEKTFRIIALGDSFTFGDNIPTEKNWTELLEKYLNESFEDCDYEKYEILNLALPGHDAQYIVTRYKNIGQKYNPDLIIWFDSGSGFTRINELTKPLLYECFDRVNPRKMEESEMTIENANLCYGEAYDKLFSTYSKEDITTYIEHQYDVFFDLPHTQNTQMIFYKDFEHENNQERYEKWKEKYSMATYTRLVPNMKSDETLPDGHPNITGQETLFKHISEYLVNNNIICQNK